MEERTYRIKLVFDNDEDLDIMWNQVNDYKRYFPEIGIVKELSYMQDDYRCEESVETAWNNLLKVFAFVFYDCKRTWKMGTEAYYVRGENWKSRIKI